MATVENKQLAGQKTHSRWGHLEFNAQGQCEVSDDVGRQIAEAGLHGFQVYGLPQPEADDIDNESLEDETGSDDAVDADSDEGEEGDEEVASEGDDIDNESLDDDASPETPKAKKTKKNKLGKKKKSH